MFVELQREWMGQKAGTIIDLIDADAKLSNLLVSIRGQPTDRKQSNLRV